MARRRKGDDPITVVTHRIEPAIDSRGGQARNVINQPLWEIKFTAYYRNQRGEGASPITYEGLEPFYKKPTQREIERVATVLTPYITRPTKSSDQGK